jgi:hypothetical protein
LSEPGVTKRISFIIFVPEGVLDVAVLDRGPADDVEDEDGLKEVKV